MPETDRPRSDLLFDPPNRLRASDIRRSEITHLTMLISIHHEFAQAAESCQFGDNACPVPHLHNYVDSALDLPVSVGHKNSKLFSETAIKESWERPSEGWGWDPSDGAPPNGQADAADADQEDGPRLPRRGGGDA